MHVEFGTKQEIVNQQYKIQRELSQLQTSKAVKSICKLVNISKRKQKIPMRYFTI